MLNLDSKNYNIIYTNRIKSNAVRKLILEYCRDNNLYIVIKVYPYYDQYVYKNNNIVIIKSVSRNVRGLKADKLYIDSELYNPNNYQHYQYINNNIIPMAKNNNYVVK